MGVFVGVEVCVAVGEGEAERLGVVDGVVLALKLAVEEKLLVGVGERDGEAEPEKDGLDDGEGVGEGGMHCADEPEPKRMKPVRQAQFSVGPKPVEKKPGEHVHVVGEPLAVEPSGQAAQRRFVTYDAPLE